MTDTPKIPTHDTLITQIKCSCGTIHSTKDKVKFCSNCGKDIRLDMDSAHIKNRNLHRRRLENLDEVGAAFKKDLFSHNGLTKKSVIQITPDKLLQYFELECGSRNYPSIFYEFSSFIEQTK